MLKVYLSTQPSSLRSLSRVCVCESSLDIHNIQTNERGGVVQDQLVKMFYNNIAHITCC